MQKKGSMLKYLDVFKITEEPEEVASSGYSDNVLERFELLKAEILKLGKSQLQARMFAKSEYQALREAIDTLSANGSDPVADMVIEGLLSIADGLDAGIKAGRGKSMVGGGGRRSFTLGTPARFAFSSSTASASSWQ